MYIESLKLKRFRNYSNQMFELKNGMFIIHFLPLSDAEIEDLNFDKTKLIGVQ